MWPHTDFDEVFAGGRFGDFDVSMRRVGDLVVTSGCVAVFDPDYGSSVEVHGLPVGTFPVEAAVVKYEAHDGQREAIASVRVVFERERAATWEMQKPDHDRPHPPFEIAGIDAESGRVALGDREGALVEVTAGYGTHDRTYAAYLGRTSDGRPTALAMDFEVLTVPLFEFVELPLPLPIGRIDDPLFTRIGVEAWAISPNELELRGDVARICFGRVGDRTSASIDPIVQTRPSFVQRFTFKATSGRAFVKVYVGCRPV